MGKRGIRPLPNQLRLLRGERADRVNTDEPIPREGLPVCPDDVDPEVREVWDYALGELVAMRIATPADRDALLAWCEAVVTHRRASRLIAEHGVVTLLTNGAMGRNPATAVQREAAALIKAFAGEFAFTPSARSEIRAAAAGAAGTERKGAERLLS